MTHAIGDNSACYENSRIDAVVVEALAGDERPGGELARIIDERLCGGELHADDKEAFRVEAYTNIMRWLRIAHRIAGDPDPGIAAIAETARSTARLTVLSERAADRAATPDALSDVRGFVKFLTGEWLALHSTLGMRLDETLSYVGAMGVTVTSRDGTRMSRVGERSGSWSLWDPESLPVAARTAALEAIEELRAGSSAEPVALDVERREPVEPPKLPRFAQVSLDTLLAETAEDGDRDLETMWIATIELAARSTQLAQHTLEEVGTLAERLRSRALTAVTDLENASDSLCREVSRLAKS